MIKLNHIQHLLALADERHFARAAERVHLSQPAFSRSIQAIESSTGLRLFERSNGAARPTPAGEFLITRARQLLFDARSLERDLQYFSQAQLGDTAIGLGPFPAATLLPRVMTEVRKRHPQVNLRVSVSNWRQLLEKLLAEELEFFVAHTRLSTLPANVEMQPLMRQQAGFYVRDGHPLDGAPRRLREIWGYGVAATALPQVEKDMVAQVLGLAPGAGVNLVLECDDITTLHALALDTDTVVVTTDVAARLCASGASLRRLNLSDFPGVAVEMGMVSLRNRTLSPLAQQLVRIFHETVQPFAPVPNHGEIRP